MVEGGHGKAAQMIPVDRPTGQNDVGIVSWLITLKTPECPQGRQVHTLCNITQPHPIPLHSSTRRSPSSIALPDSMCSSPGKGSRSGQKM